jgi:capsular exopolysaccharide synthesis family protein
MSRIHEALQRAYLERGKAPSSGNIQVVEPMVDSHYEDPAAPNYEEPAAPKVEPRVEVVLENVAKKRWNPSLTSFPTLAERGAGVEQFRSLRSHVYQARYEAPLKTILIASGMPAEGKSFIAANLAMSLARNSIHNILLIDGDLRRPTLHSLLGAPNTPGLADYLAGTADLSDIMQRDKRAESGNASGADSISNLTFIPSGKCSDSASELIANHRIEELVATAAPSFDWIVIDAPPVLAVTDSVDLARAADAVLLVARGSRTPYEVAQRAKAAFGSARILGFVLNDVKDAPHRGSYKYNYNYNYNYYHDAEQELGNQGKPRKE